MKFQLECAIWEFTLECNLRCSHCGSSAGIARPDELKTKECFKLCEDMAELGCLEVAIMGGEPFLRKDWLSVAQCIKNLGINVNFVSNGIVLEKYIDKISRLEPQVIGISIDGMRESHDRIRGEGTWEKSVRSIELLREHGIQTTIITTVSNLNFKDLPLIKDFIYKKGINWQIQTAMPFGNFTKDQMINPDKFYEVGRFIADSWKNNSFEELPVVGAHCLGYFSKNEDMPCHEWNGCWAGISSIGITSDGGILGCLSMGNDRFVEGYVREQSLIEIWENPNNFSYNREFNESKLGPNCRNCKFGIQCKGGCNSVSYILTKEFHNDPYCFYLIEKKEDEK